MRRGTRRRFCLMACKPFSGIPKGAFWGSKRPPWAGAQGRSARVFAFEVKPLAVVLLAGEDRRRAVELFQEDDPGQLMGEREGGQR